MITAAAVLTYIREIRHHCHYLDLILLVGHINDIVDDCSDLKIIYAALVTIIDHLWTRLAWTSLIAKLTIYRENRNVVKLYTESNASLQNLTWLWNNKLWPICLCRKSWKRNNYEAFTIWLWSPFNISSMIMQTQVFDECIFKLLYFNDFLNHHMT